MPPPEGRQFGVLYRLSLARIVDLEILSSRGDLTGLFARVSGALLALSLTMVVALVVPYWTHAISGSDLVEKTWTDEEFLISLTLVVAGMLSVLAWNHVLPDRRDCLVLGTLPVRTRTTALAKLAAILTCIAIAVGAVNTFIGLTFPYVTAGGLLDGLRSIFAWWATVMAAGIFVFASTLAIQGAAAQLLRWNAFVRVSGALQLVSLFLVAGFFFLTPPFASTLTHAPELAAFLPSFWFTGLLHALKGDRNPALAPLAAACIRNLIAVVGFAGCVFALSWFRHSRTIAEATGITSGSGRTILAWCGNLLVRSLFRRPLDRAIVLFTARTAARSGQHRLLLAAWGGVGFALAVVFSRSLLGASGMGYQLSASSLVTGMVLIVCAVFATRAVFALPHTLRANWIFRITAVQSPAAYFNAVRKSLIALAAVPAAIVCGGAYLAVWPGRISVEAFVVLLMLGSILVDYKLYRFRKIPFACSWLPSSGQSVNTVRAIAFAFAFLTLAWALGGTELWAIGSVARFVVLCTCLAAWAVWLRRRGQEFASSPGNMLQFDDIPDPEILALDLRPDAEWSGHSVWITPTGERRSAGARLWSIGFIVIFVAAAGFVYERAGEWRDRREFPQIGRSIDIGGRSLNIYCAGQGSPAVVMDSGGNQPGYSWMPVQRGIADFARACWYDRAGYGWSDPVPGPRTSADIADDLHKLLHAAGIAPPYVLVGHSFGGFTVRVFASRYHSEIAGLVLVDSATEHEGEIQPPRSIQAPAVRYIPRILLRPLTVAAWFLVHDGAERLLDDGPETPPPGSRMTERDLAIMHVLQMQPKAFDVSLQESASRPQSIRQVLAVHDLGNIPLIVLTAGKHYAPPSDPEETRLSEAFYQWRVYKDQPRMLSLSTHSRQIVLQDGHDIPEEDPDAVIDAVREVRAVAGH